MGVPVIFATADEVVWALLRAGFAVRERTAATVLLANCDRIAEVPVGHMIAPQQLLSILRHAGISYTDFVELIADDDTDPGESTASQARRKSLAPSERTGSLDNL